MGSMLSPCGVPPVSRNRSTNGAKTATWTKLLHSVKEQVEQDIAQGSGLDCSGQVLTGTRAIPTNVISTDAWKLR